MKAVQVNSYGGAEVLEYKTDVAVPTLKPDQVLVEVHAAGLNPFDLMVLSGAYQKMMPLQFPLTFGGDLAGVITKLGKGVSGLQIGDEVYGSAIPISGGSGAYAQTAAMNAQKTARKPKNISFEEAAALPVAGMTAVEAIVDHIQPKPGQKVLIHGGAGGVGHLAIQQAKALGAYVITTVSGDDATFVKKLGADQVIDYKTQNFEEILSDLDSVLETIGGAVSDKSYQVLKPGGVLVLLTSDVNEELAKKYGVKAIHQQSKTESPQLQRLAQLVEKGTLKVHIDQVFPLDQAREAFAHLDQGHPQGKVVLEIK